jgi:hypothetical protein
MKYLLIFVFSSITVHLCSAQNSILSFDFSGENTGQFNDWKNTSLLNDDLEILTGISKGTGLAGRTGDDSYNTGSFSADDLDEAIANEEYISFQLQSENGKELDLQNADFSFNLKRSSTGPRNFTFLTNVKGFSSTDVIYADGLSDQSNQTFNFKFPNDPIYNVGQNVVEIRLYAWNASSTAGNFRINELSLAVDESSVEASINSAFDSSELVSSVNTADEPIFSFQVYHPGNRVGDVPIKISGFSLLAGTDNEFSDWQEIFENVKLKVEGDNAIANIQNAGVIFEDLENDNVSDIGFISMGQSKTYDLLISLKDDIGVEKYSADGKKIQVSITDSDLNIEQGKVIDFEINSDPNRNIIDVEATKMSIISSFPNEVEIGENFTPSFEIQAEDINGNRDLDYVGTIASTFSSTCGDLSGGSENYNSGLASFNDLQLNTQKVDAKLSFSSPDFSTIVSPEFDVVYSGRTTLSYYNFETDLLPVEGTVGNENYAVGIIGLSGISLESILESDGQTASENGWNTEPAYWIVGLNTEDFTGLQISFEQRSSNTGPKDFQLQYKIGEMGSWENIANGNYSVANDFNTGKIINLNLPTAIDDQELIYIRWLKSSNTAVNGGSISNLGVNNIDNILFTGSAVQDITNSRFRFKTISGNWLDACNWEIFQDGEWKSTQLAPNGEASQITIPANAIVKIDEEKTANFSKILIDKNGFLHLSDNAQLECVGNASAPQLEVMGELWDAPNSGSCLVLNEAKWILGNSGSLIKSSGSATMFREQYHHGIENIPANASWIYRKIENKSPVSSILTANMIYPNLIIESYDGNYDNPILNSASSDLTILGDLDIGGDGTGSVELTTRYRSSDDNPLVLNGDLIIKNTSILNNLGGGSTKPGIGINIKGSAIIDGTLDFTGGGDIEDKKVGQLIFSDNDHMQNLSGSGNVKLHDLQIDNSDQDVLLGIDLEIQNQLVLNSGALNLDGNNVFLNGNAELFENRMEGYIVYDETAVDKNEKGGYLLALNRTVNNNMTDIAGLGVFLSDADSYNVDVKRYHYRVIGFDGNQGVNKVYELEGNPTATEMKLQLADYELLDFEMENISLYRYDEDKSQWVLFENGKVIDEENNVISVTGVDQFSIWSAGSTNSPLPVELVYFDYENRANHEYLVWATASETRNGGFEIQSSDNGKKFKSIDFLPSAHQSGNSQSLTNYQYLIKDHEQSKFYRLKQIDFDGEYEFSPVLKNDIDFELILPTVYPNPFSDATSIYLSDYSKVESIRIYDEMGKLKDVLLKRDSFLIENFQKWGREASKGLYLLKIISEHEENSKLVKLIKE